MAQIMKELEPGETMEISEAYIGQIEKLPTRVIIHRLTNDQTEIRLKNQAVREKKKGIIMKDKRKQLMGINVYITNTSRKEVSTTYVHSLYSLRWQIEILFKTWKSFFEIDECKNMMTSHSDLSIEKFLLYIMPPLFYQLFVSRLKWKLVLRVVKSIPYCHNYDFLLFDFSFLFENTLYFTPFFIYICNIWANAIAIFTYG